MKSRIALSVLFVLVAATAFAADAAIQSDAQKSFTTMKTLAGEWEGPVTVPDAPQMSGVKMHLSLRVTSRGNTLVHEFQEVSRGLSAGDVEGGHGVERTVASPAAALLRVADDAYDAEGFFASEAEILAKWFAAFEE